MTQYRPLKCLFNSYSCRTREYIVCVTGLWRLQNTFVFWRHVYVFLNRCWAIEHLRLSSTGKGWYYTFVFWVSLNVVMWETKLLWSLSHILHQMHLYRNPVTYNLYVYIKMLCTINIYICSHVSLKRQNDCIANTSTAIHLYCTTYVRTVLSYW